MAPMSETTKLNALDQYLKILAESRRVADEKVNAEVETRRLEKSAWEKASNIVVTYSARQPHVGRPINYNPSPPRALPLTNGGRYEIWLKVDYLDENEPRPLGVIMNGQTVDKDHKSIGKAMVMANFRAHASFAKDQLPESPFPLDEVWLPFSTDPLSTVPEYLQKLEATRLIDGIMTDYQAALEADTPEPYPLTQFNVAAKQIVP